MKIFESKKIDSTIIDLLITGDFVSKFNKEWYSEDPVAKDLYEFNVNLPNMVNAGSNFYMTWKHSYEKLNDMMKVVSNIYNVNLSDQEKYFAHENLNLEYFKKHITIKSFFNTNSIYYFLEKQKLIFEYAKSIINSDYRLETVYFDLDDIKRIIN
jgi:hypothetical protein